MFEDISTSQLALMLLRKRDPEWPAAKRELDVRMERKRRGLRHYNKITHRRELGSYCVIARNAEGAEVGRREGIWTENA
jgi:hypothetical protein